LSTCSAYWLKTAVNTLSVALLDAPTVDVEELEAWCEVPDVVEADFSELATPAGGDADSAEDGGDLVAAALPEVEAAVGELPHAVDAVGALGFC